MSTWCTPVVVARALRRHAIGAGDARPVEQRIKNERRVLRRSGLEPEFGEARKFLRRREARVDGEAACRKAVLIERPGRAEIGSAHEREPVRLEIRRHDAKAREPDIVGQLPRRVVGRDIEQVGAVENLSCLAAVDDIDVHGVARVAAEVKHLHRQALLLVEHQAHVAPVADLLIGVVIDALENFRRGRRYRVPLGRGELLGPLLQNLERERAGLSERCAYRDDFGWAWRWRPRHGLAWRAASRARKRRRRRAFGAD